ncbi:MAG: hypothetical protein AB7O66_08205 [Limisphaerales bacterium]
MRASRHRLAVIALIGSSLAACAQLPAPKLSWVFPAGAPAGSTLEVTTAGSDLDEPVRLVFSDPRITTAPSTNSAPVFTVTVPADVPPGWVDVRFAGRFGVSNPRGFEIGNRPETVVPPTNTTPAKAAEISVDTVVNSRVLAAETHWYRFSARAAQPLLFSVRSEELDSRLVPDLVLLTPDLRELRVARRGGHLAWTAPSDGPYLLRIQDQTYRGGDDYVYRLSLSSAPHVEFTLPLALGPDAEEAVPFRVFGRNLPGSCPTEIAGADGLDLERLDAELVSRYFPRRPEGLTRLPPPASVLADDLVAAEFGIGIASNATVRWILPKTPYPTSWTASNGLRNVNLPCDFSGLFPRRGEISGVTFQATKDAIHWIEVFSERLGFPADPHLVVQRISRTKAGEEEFKDVLELADFDKNMGGREFETTSRDPVGRFKVPEDGAYRVLLRDLNGGGSRSRRLPYRLQIRPETPDFRLAVFPEPPPRKDDNDRQIHLWTASIRPGETIPVRVVAFRRDGFDGPIDLTVEGLSTGVSASPARIPQGESTTTLLVSAGTNAPAGPGRVTVRGTATIGDQDVRRDAIASSARWHVPDWNQERGTPRFAASLDLGVVSGESIPVSLTPSGPLTVEVQAAGKLAIPVQIQRSGEFNGGFTIQPYGHSALSKAKGTEAPENATNVVVELNLADSPLPEGEHHLHFEGSVAGKYRSNPTDEKAKPKDVTLRVYSPSVMVKVTAPPKPKE